MKELIDKLILHNIDISVVGENLELKIPQEGEYNAVLQEIRDNKAALISFLKDSYKQQKGLSVPVSPQKEYYQLSSMQRRFYFLYELDKTTLSYNMPELIRVTGVLDHALLESAFRKLIMRHEILRTSFVLVNGEPFQRVEDDFEFQINQYQVKPGEQASVTDEFVRPFDLSKGPLLRMGLIDFGNNEYLLLIDMHHIVMDGVSQGILIRDFMSLYYGESLPELDLQYRDYAEWQQSDARQERLKAQESFWLKVYEELPETLNLPLDQPRPLARNHEGGRVNFEIGEEETLRLRALAEKAGGTMFMVLLAIYNVLLSRLGNQEDIVVGIPTAGRPHADVEDMLGMFVNTLALRNYPHGNLRFSEFLTEVRDQTLQYFDNQDYQYEDLIDQLKVERSLERNPLFDVMFAYENVEEMLLELPGLKLEGYSREELISKFDLTLTASESGNGLQLNFEYAKDIFNEDTINRIAGYYQRIVSAVTANAEVLLKNIAILSAEERQHLLIDFNGEEVIYPKDKTIIDLFEEQVIKNPGYIAAIYKEEEISYGELAGKVNGLLNTLRLNGIQKGDRIAIVIDHSPELLTALLAVMKGGCTFVPIDVKWPLDRQELCIKTVDARLVLCHKNNQPFKAENLLAIAYQDIESIVHIEKTPIDFEDSIYIIYTSGTTGVPKGVEIPYKGIMNRLFWMNDFFGAATALSVIQTTRYVYDSAVWQFFWPLINGGKTIILPEDFEMTSDNFCQLIEQHQVSMADFMPSIFNALFDYSSEQEDVANSKLNSLKYIIQGGEELSDKVTKRFIKHYSFIKLINLYGPTEGSIGCIYYLIKDKMVGKIPIGKPISNMYAWILDTHGNLLPVGAPGELYISGEGIAKGYVNSPEQTAERFIPNPFGSGNMYKTGDRVRRLKDGNIGFIGRVDNQVKIRGFRIELGEVEHQLSLHPDLSDVAVDCRERSGDKFLVAYYVSAKAISTNELRDFLLIKLPEYMVPSYFVFLQALPLTAGGKIDKKLLPAPDVLSGADYVAPSNEVEHALVDIWSEILRLPPEAISITKSFFELGGHSLRAMILMNAISKKMKISISLRDIFVYQDIRRLSAFILRQEEQVYLQIPKADKQTYYKLSSAQQRLYFIYEFDRSALHYNMARMIRLTGVLNRDLLETAFRKLIVRHEILRTSFLLIDGEPFQRVEDDFEFEISHYQLKHGEEKKITDEFVRPFVLGKGPLLRVGLIDFGDNEYLLLVDMHHIIMDGVSQSILIRDFMSFYQGNSLPELNLQYRDYAEWQQSDTRQERLKIQESFWLRVYEEYPEALHLPLYQPRSLSREPEGGQVSFGLSEKQTLQLRSLAEKTGGTMFMVLLAIYNVMLSRLDNQEDVVVGVPTAGRSHADVEDMLGMFVNTLALRNYPTRNLRFSEFLTDLRDRTLQYFDNQDYQYEDLIFKLKVKRSLERNPLFDVMFVFENTEESLLELPGLKLEAYNNEGMVSKFDLTLTASKNGEGLQLNLEYAKDIFTEETITQMAEAYQRIVAAVIANAEVVLADIDILSDKQTAINLFEEQTSKNPDQVVVVHDGKSLTYQELSEKSDQVADYLKQQGIAAGDVVGISMKNSSALFIGIMGVLKSGAAYTPVDPDYPVEQINQLINVSKLKFLVVDPDFKEQPGLLETDYLVLDDNLSVLSAISIE
ncbi:amino acid adenylation domain-containing protein [Pedobacter cryoconitis]|uniref:Amino acid adenylation domain-containing protein n=1 Tax=Pedobacter cryoconitis TaxID=188932 RepID=A0A7W8ZJE4_9SPHI|nr:non-ribosomal peptide synthetase [Pedobacter cryoconitis]MBB5635111.1 amino acid adenylation domain-containing protein [Pedobacter cryoconitis]MBB6271705.1 amino acid adenylation domain-containing protein [Pedobacter cryoconitis]